MRNLIGHSRSWIAFSVLLAAVTILIPVRQSYAQIPQIEMISVKGGCFQMGDTSGNGCINEEPPHDVCVADFSIGKYEVTQAQWQAVMGNNPSKFIGDHRPVDSVSWNDAQAFISKLSRLTGIIYRLPTEAEWEYAARSGGQREKYAGTSNTHQVGEYAWFNDNSTQRTHTVGTKRPNQLGLHDMCGNVSEWVQDCYSDVYYKESPRENPRGPRMGNARVLRGGSWVNYARFVRTRTRLKLAPAERLDIVGFRLAATAR